MPRANRVMPIQAVLRRTGDFLRREKEVLFAFAVSRLLLWGFAWGSWRWFDPGEFPVKARPALWDLLYRWDATWYGRIVRESYSYQPNAETTVAFFPVLPLLVTLTRSITTAHLALAGFLVSNMALLACAIALRRLVALDYPSPSRTSERAVWLLLFCPMTLFHSAFYTESLYLAFSVAAVLLARRGHWLGAGLNGFLLSGTRANGVLILIPLLCEAFVRQPEERRGNHRDRRLARSRWWLAIVPGGLFAYMGYLQFRFGDALAFAKAQKAWGRSIAPPWVGIRDALQNEFPYGAMLVAFGAVAVALCFVAIAVRQRRSYQIYAAVFVGLSVSSSIYHSLPRYLSVVFPFYITLAAATRRGEGIYLSVFAASAGLMALCTALFVCGYFIN